MATVKLTWQTVLDESYCNLTQLNISLNVKHARHVLEMVFLHVICNTVSNSTINSIFIYCIYDRVCLVVKLPFYI